MKNIIKTIISIALMVSAFYVAYLGALAVLFLSYGWWVLIACIISIISLLFAIDYLWTME